MTAAHLGEKQVGGGAVGGSGGGRRGHGGVAEAEEPAIDEAKALLATKKLRAAMKTRGLEELQSAIAIAEAERVVDAAVLDEAKDLVPELAPRILHAESEDTPSYTEANRFTQKYNPLPQTLPARLNLSYPEAQISILKYIFA